MRDGDEEEYSEQIEKKNRRFGCFNPGRRGGG
jgi:hypothetical protein